MKRLSGRDSTSITVDLEGEAIPAREGEPVACSLLAAGEKVFARSVKYHRPRGPFCFQDSCSHCLMRVDGLPNLPTCRVAARPGMKLERQNAFPSAEVDVFGAIDWLFPRGLDHHQMFAGVPVAETVMAKVARHLAGLGKLPAHPSPIRLPSQVIRTEVAVVGAGAAGSAAAYALLQAGVETRVVEREAEVGGRLLYGPPEEGAPLPPTLPAQALLTQATAIGLFDDEQGRYLAVVQDPGAALPDLPPAGRSEASEQRGPRLIRIYARRFVLANGGHPEMVAFENNDLPGVYSGRMVSALIRRHGLLPGREFVLAGYGPELSGLAQLIQERGGQVNQLISLSPSTGPTSRLIRAHGLKSVSAVTALVDGKRERFSCDALVLAAPPAPAFALARQGGAEVRFSHGRGAFVVEADEAGRTHSPEVFVAGELVGLLGAAECAGSAGQGGR